MERLRDTASPNHFPVVCLAGSAGGLEAYKEVLRQLPSDTGMAFVIVSHRGNGDAGLLAQLLGRVTSMPVIEVKNCMLLKPDHVFVTPPQTEITTDGIVLHLRAALKQLGWPVTISVFLASLATTCRGRSVAVILSGMGHDGSSALASIQAEGGVTFAQSDAIHVGMPQSAKDTGHVNYMLTATEIGRRLAAMNR